MLSIHLTSEQRAELAATSRRAAGRVALRAQMVLLSAEGRSVPEIAALHRCGRDVVRTWLHRYAAGGVAALADRPRGGCPPRDTLARRIVDAQASQSPRCAATCGRAVGAGGGRASPLPAPGPVSATRGTRRVLFLDECDLHLLPVLRACWQQGPRLRVPTPGTNAKRAFFGALDAASGAFHVADHDRKLAAHFVAFLQGLADTYPDEQLTLVLDNVQMHDAKVVRAWRAANPRVAVLWLPRYAAHDANPAERIWGLLKDKVAANRLVGTLTALVAVAHRFFATLPPHPVPPSFLADETAPNLRQCA